MALSEIQSIVKEGIDENEIDRLQNAVAEMLEQHPEAINSTEIQKVIKILENALKEWVITTDDTRTKVGEMRDSLSKEITEATETLSNRKSFPHLKEEFWTYIGTNASMKFFQEQFDGIVERLAPDVSAEIRDTMMLPVWRKWISHMDELWVAAWEAVKYMMSLWSEWKEIEKGSWETLVGKMFQEIEDFVVRVDSVQKQVTQTWKTDLDFTNSSIIDAIFRGEDDPEKLRLLNTSHEAYFEETRKLTEKYATNIKDMDASIWGMIKMLGWEEFWKKLGEYAKENPWFGVILSILWLWGFLEWFIDGSEKKRMQSLAQLTTLSSTDNSPIPNFIPDSFFKDFDYKKLDPFFKHLASQKIDFTHENFWQNLLSGDSKDTKITEIHNVLLNESWTIFIEDDFKDWGKGMIEKLNSLPKIEQQQKQEELQATKTKLASALPPIAWVTIVTWIDFEDQVTEGDTPPDHLDTKEWETSWEGEVVEDRTQEEIGEQSHEIDPQTETEEQQAPIPEVEKSIPERTPEQIESDKNKYIAFRDLEIAENLSNATEFPVIFNYTKQKEYLALWIDTPKSLDFKDWTFLINNIPYGIHFKWVTHESATIGSIKLDNAELDESSMKLSLTAKGTKKIIGISMSWEEIKDFFLSKSELWEIFLWLIESGTISQDIPKWEWITWWTYTLSKS